MSGSRATVAARSIGLAGVLITACGLMPGGPAMAGWLPGRAAADKESVRPLREADLAAAIDGTRLPPGWKEAADRLPQRCSEDEALAASDCDDDIRCGWLAARARAIRSWEAGSTPQRAASAARLHRAAQRMLSGGQCGGKRDQQRWSEDRRAAVVDDARAHLGLLATSPHGSGPLVTDPGDRAALAGLVATVRASGLGAVAERALVRRRLDLRAAWKRASWLDGQPVISTLRETLPELWRPAGGIPRGCGERLLDAGLLEDQWRGFLVREVIPQALRCLAASLPRALARQGQPAVDPDGAIRLAQSLAAEASADAGGRSFGKDPQVLEKIEQLVASLEPRPQRLEPPPTRMAEKQPISSRKADTRPVAEPSPAAKPGSEPERPPARAAARATPTDPPAARAPRGGAPRATEAAREAAQPAQGELSRIARSASVWLGERERWEARARAAGDGPRRERWLQSLFVALHRRVCGPLEQAELEDVEAARRILSQLGAKAPVERCRGGEGLEALTALLEAADDLDKLGAAAMLRRAARLIALDRPVEARLVLHEMPERMRGATWSVLYAWAARKEGDPVAANRALARVDGEVIDRWRTSGVEEVARLVSRAWASLTP
ncbi:MAG: hypothetical protein JSV80_11155 [Acidobacteriota bacterium]|nr:MAG: hypothetical protein JSV80_11155 [Acidobacteriota bacterium]